MSEQSIQEFVDFLEKVWFDVPTTTCFESTVDVWMGWMGKEGDEFWAESYQINKPGFMTGRNGFLRYYRLLNTELPGFPIKFSIFKTEVTREEFLKVMELENEVAAIDAELNIKR